MKTKLLSVGLSIVMILSFFATPIMAEEYEGDSQDPVEEEIIVEEDLEEADEEFDSDPVPIDNDDYIDAEAIEIEGGGEITIDEPIITKQVVKQNETIGKDPMMSVISGNLSSTTAEYSFKNYDALGESRMRADIYPSKTKDSFYYLAYIYEDYTGKWFVCEYNITTKKSKKIAELTFGYGRNYYYRDDIIFYRNDTLFYLENLSSGTGKTNVRSINLNTGANTVFTTIEGNGGHAQTFAIDSKNNLYIANTSTTLSVYDKTGKQLATFTDEDGIYEIFAIDESNGNIYYESQCNWVYFGYDHYMACLKVARFTGSGIQTSPAGKYITILYQNHWFTHYGPIELIGNKYLADLSTFAGNLFILNSSKISPKNVVEGSTTISLIDSGVSVSGVNLSNVDATHMAVGTHASSYPDDYDETSVGSRCTYFSTGGKNIIAVSVGDNTIKLYDADKKKEFAKITTKYPVYKVMVTKNNLVALEKDLKGNYYVESFSTALPKAMSISGPTSVKVGSRPTYSASMSTDIKPNIVFTSSNPSVLSIDEAGNASAWSPGTVTLTAKSSDGTLKKTLTVKVTGKTNYNGANPRNVKGWISNNKNTNNYGSYGRKVYSYLTEINSNKLMRVEGKSDGAVHVEYLDRTGKVTSKKTIKKELAEFEGFFAGKDAYFIVFGQNNLKENDKLEVLRVVKYDKSWNRKAACSIKKINTYIPVDAGSLRMAENNGILYIHTCHEMYAGDDGLHHQANMTFEITESSMNLKDSYTGVMNLSEGYVSHSFNQFIRIANGMVYRVDHGDAHPRGIAFTGYPVSGKMSNPTTRGTLVSFDGGTGANYTGASLGGFEISKTNAIVAYNQDVEMYGNVRNICVTALDLKAGDVKTYKITNYKSNAEWTCLTPQLVKLTDRHFYLMWIEQNIKTGKERCGYTRLDIQGKKVGGHNYTNWTLSDCQPTRLSDGSLAWYVTDGKTMKLYNIEPFHIYPSSIKLNKTTAKIKKNNTLSLTPTFTPANVTSKKVMWSSSNKKVATVDSTGKVTAVGEGTATITAMTCSGYTATCKITVTGIWQRLWGQKALDTMAAITKEFGKSDVAILTTNNDFRDALAASSLAGRYSAPVMMTAKKSLSKQTKSELKRMGIKTVYIVGSTNEVSATVEAQIKSAGVKDVKRIAGATPSDRAIAVSKALGGKRSDTVIIATQTSYFDALSISPYAYASKSPIIYVEENLTLSKASVKHIRKMGFKKAIIVGGPVAIPYDVEKQLKEAGIANSKITRLAGANAYKTSLIIANWSIGKVKNGTNAKSGKLYQYANIKAQPSVIMSPNTVGVATGQGWHDALAGAALCGKNKGVLLLEDAKNYSNTSFTKANKGKIKVGYVFGGPVAISDKVYEACIESTR